MSTVRVTCGHLELGKKVVCEGCYKASESENARLKEELERTEQNQKVGFTTMKLLQSEKGERAYPMNEYYQDKIVRLESENARLRGALERIPCHGLHGCDPYVNKTSKHSKGCCMGIAQQALSPEAGK